MIRISKKRNRSNPKISLSAIDIEYSFSSTKTTSFTDEEYNPEWKYDSWEKKAITKTKGNYSGCCIKASLRNENPQHKEASSLHHDVKEFMKNREKRRKDPHIKPRTVESKDVISSTSEPIKSLSSSHQDSIIIQRRSHTYSNEPSNIKRIPQIRTFSRTSSYDDIDIVKGNCQSNSTKMGTTRATTPIKNSKRNKLRIKFLMISPRKKLSSSSSIS